MTPKQEKRDRKRAERRDTPQSDSYNADWQRKSKAEIVESAILSLRDDIKRAVRKKSKAA
jgi:hypothetical protein